MFIYHITGEVEIEIKPLVGRKSLSNPRVDKFVKDKIRGEVIDAFCRLEPIKGVRNWSYRCGLITIPKMRVHCTRIKHIVYVDWQCKVETPLPVNIQDLQVWNHYSIPFGGWKSPFHGKIIKGFDYDYGVGDNHDVIVKIIQSPEMVACGHCNEDYCPSDLCYETDPWGINARFFSYYKPTCKKCAWKFYQRELGARTDTGVDPASGKWIMGDYR